MSITYVPLFEQNESAMSITYVPLFEQNESACYILPQNRRRIHVGHKATTDQEPLLDFDDVTKSVRMSES
jgi:hypothetical protein